MKRTLGFGLALAVLRASPAVAAELELGIDAGVVYDDNVFSSTTDEQDDMSVTLGPRIRMLDESGSLTWGLHYRPVYERYQDLEDADGWDHDLFANATWRVSPRTSIGIVERFLDTNNITAAFVEEGGPDPFVEPILQIGTTRTKFNQFQASLVHSLSARHGLSFGFGRYDTDYEGGVSTEVMTLGGSYRYALTPVDHVGVGLSAVQQEVGPEPIYFYSGSLQWIHQFSPTLRLDASAGPAWVDRPTPDFPEVLPARSRFPAIRTPGTALGIAPVRASSCRRMEGTLRVLDASCEPFPEGSFEPAAVVPFLVQETDLPRLGDEPSNDPTITYFAAINLSKQWRDLQVTLSYVRDASTTSQIGGLVSDTFSIQVTWFPPARPWRVSFWADYGQREFPGGGTGLELLVMPSTVGGLSDVAESVGFQLVEVDRTQSVDVILAGLYATYDLGRSTKLYLTWTWQQEQYDFEINGVSRKWDRMRVGVGIVYTHPRFNLPF